MIKKAFTLIELLIIIVVIGVLVVVLIVVLIAVPPFPYQAINNKYNPRGLRISFCEPLTNSEWQHIHFSEVSQSTSSSFEKEVQEGLPEREFIISGKSGYVMCVTSSDKKAEEARKKTYSLADKIVIPRMFFRHDIGLKFIERDRVLLKKWGYL